MMSAKHEAYFKLVRQARAENTVREITSSSQYGPATADAITQGISAGLTLEELNIAGKIGRVLGEIDRKPDLKRQRVKTI